MEVIHLLEDRFLERTDTHAFSDGYVTDARHWRFLVSAVVSNMG